MSKRLSEEHKRNISKGVKKHLPSTAFKKGFTPHNKGKEGCVNSGSFKKGHPCLNNVFHKNHQIRNTGQTHFKKGHIPIAPFKKGMVAWNKGKNLPHIAGENNPNWKGGRKMLHGYIIVYSPKHPSAVKNYVPEHRLVVEKNIGHFLKSTDLVHHVNKIKDDNRPQNLMAFKNHAYHSNFHRGFKIKPEGIIFDGRNISHVTSPF